MYALFAWIVSSVVTAVVGCFISHAFFGLTAGQSASLGWVTVMAMLFFSFLAFAVILAVAGFLNPKADKDEEPSQESREQAA
jgi:Na+/H+-dicarboxylate symporter